MATVIMYAAPGFEGHILEDDGEIVCVLAPTVFTDRGIRARVRRLVHGQGIDCKNCLGCPIGRAE